MVQVPENFHVIVHDRVIGLQRIGLTYNIQIKYSIRIHVRPGQLIQRHSHFLGDRGSLCQREGHFPS